MRHGYLKTEIVMLAREGAKKTVSPFASPNRVILILQKFEILNFACCQIVPICSLISELFLFLL